MTKKFPFMKRSYMNPYLAGTLLGIVLLTAMVVAGRGLGASGGYKYCVVSIVGAVDPPHAENSEYYSKYFENGKKPLTTRFALKEFYKEFYHLSRTSAPLLKRIRSFMNYSPTEI